MKNIVVDTCTVIHIVKASPQGIKCLETIAQLDESPNIIISVATKAELGSFSSANKWGDDKIKKLTAFLNSASIININAGDSKLLDAYVQIDGYSKRKLTDKNGQLLPGSAKKMGKNDLWIAATAHVIEAPLVTTDGDFDHLHNQLLTVIKVV
jgi:tRNA(fMet)-specific endonuclease VapC